MRDYQEKSRWLAAALIGAVLSISLSFGGCKKDEPAEPPTWQDEAFSTGENTEVDDVETTDSATSIEEGTIDTTFDPGSAEDTGDGTVSDDDGTADTDLIISTDFACDTWDSDLVAIEDQIVSIINERRVSGYDCAGTAVVPAPEIAVAPQLHCAARYHSRDMSTTDGVSANGSDGSTPTDLIEAFGYKNWSTWGMVVTASGNDALKIVDDLMAKQSRCESMLNAKYEDIGVGLYYDEASKYDWYTTVLLGALK